MEGGLDKRTFYAKLMRLLNTANPRVKTESVVFEKVKVRAPKKRHEAERETGESAEISSSRMNEVPRTSSSRSSNALIGGTGTGLLVSRKTRMQQYDSLKRISVLEDSL